MSENPLGNGTVRALPFWSTIGGEDGNSKPAVPERMSCTHANAIVLSAAGGVISNAIDMVCCVHLDGKNH